MAKPKHPELILGPFRPVLESALAERIQAAQSDEPGAPVVVLVGSNLLAIYLRRKLAESMPMWNVRFFTFAEIGRRLGAPRLRSLGRTPIPNLAGQFIVRDVVSAQTGGYFQPVAQLPGFIRTAAASIRDLKEAGLGPAALRKALGPKLAAFRKIYEGYEAALDARAMYDDADLLAAAAEAVADEAAGGEAPLLAGAHFITYGFYDLTGLQRRLVLALASAARSAAALVPALDAPAFEYAQPLVAWFQQHGFVPRAIETGADDLAGQLFTPPSGKSIRAGAVKMISAAGEPREVREIVRQVLEFAAQGIPFHEIGILLRNAEVYGPLLRDAFESRGIPRFITGGVPLAESREARSLEMLAELLAGDLPRGDVLQFAHVAPIAFRALLGHAPSISEWDLLSIRAGIVSGPGEWTERLARLVPRAHDADDEPPAAPAELPHLRHFIGKLIEARRSVPRSGPWATMVRPLLETYRGMMEPTLASGSVCAAVERLCELDALGLTATFDEVRDAIREVLGRERTPSAPFQRGGVFIGDLFESRGLGFRAVIIPGLVEQSFPAPGRQDPILLDGERTALSAKGGPAGGPATFLPPKSGRTAEERMLFTLAVTAGAEAATLTFSRLDVGSARERIPSHFLARLAEALEGTRYDYSTLGRFRGFVRVSMFSADDGPLVLDEDEYDLRAVARAAESGTPQRALYLARIAEPFRRGVAAETARWQEKRFTAFDGIAAHAPQKTMAGAAISATRLEAYANCPFAYFLRYVLGLKELDEPEQLTGIPALDRGSLVHDILFSAYNKYYKGRKAASGEALGKTLAAAARRTFDRRGPIGPALTWRIGQNEILDDLARLAGLDAAECSEAGARPELFEARFGMPPRASEDAGGEDEASTEKPLELLFGGKTYRFRGKIDRIDFVGERDARVIDYKTGLRSGKANSFNAAKPPQMQLQLQLPLYLLAAEVVRPDRHVTSAHYWFATSRGGFRSVEFTREALNGRMKDLEQIVVTIEQGIEQGVFAARPSEDNCRYCPLKDACGTNAAVLFERKKSDPRIAGLLELAGIE